MAFLYFEESLLLMSVYKFVKGSQQKLVWLVFWDIFSAISTFLQFLRHLILLFFLVQQLNLRLKCKKKSYKWFIRVWRLQAAGGPMNAEAKNVN